MFPGITLLWFLIFLGWLVAIVIAVRRFSHLNWIWGRTILLSLITSIGAVFYIAFVPEWPTLPRQAPEKYQHLLELLSDYYISHGYEYGSVTLALDSRFLEVEDPDIRSSMEELKISCLLYVHDRWYKNKQRGLLVAGKPTRTFGDSIVRAYKLTEKGLVVWPKSERRRGPVLSHWRASYLDGRGHRCTNSG